MKRAFTSSGGLRATIVKPDFGWPGLIVGALRIGPNITPRWEIHVFIYVGS